MATADANQKTNRRGPKRKVKDSIRVTVYIPGAVHDKLEKIGMDNVSHGVRVAVKAYEQQYGDAVVPDLLVTVK